MSTKRGMDESAVHVQGKAFILWHFDPCHEGGWSIEAGFDTAEEARAEGERRMKENRADPGVLPCYAGWRVTPGFVAGGDVVLG